MNSLSNSNILYYISYIFFKFFIKVLLVLLYYLYKRMLTIILLQQYPRYKYPCLGVFCEAYISGYLLKVPGYLVQ